MTSTTETPTETPTETAVFNSRCPNQVLTRRSSGFGEDAMGRKVVVGYEQWLERQREKNQERELAGLDPLPVDDTPWKVEFKNSVFKTSHPELIEWLRSHPLNGTDSNAPGAFFEAGRAPEEPKPTLLEQTTAIAEAQGDYDVDRLQEVLATERETHDRPAIIQAAEAALRKIAEGPSESEAAAVPDNGAPPSPDENS